MISPDKRAVSIYVRFDGKNYKLPDALTLGRGEPFDSADRTLARAHARLVYRGGKWKIKDLDTDCGIMLNGNKIKPGKFTSVKPGDQIVLGNIPLEIHESLPSYTEVKNFTVHDMRDYTPYIYGALIVMGIVIAFTESTGDTMEDVIFIGIVAAFLKLASVAIRALRTVYFPVNVVLEANLTYEGATFHITGKKNFSLKFDQVDKWYIVGKCFFIKAYGKDLIFLLNQGQEEFATLLRERCPKKRAMGEPILEKLALVPILFVLVAWIALFSSDGRFFHFVGHGFGTLGVAGLLAFFTSEHLRELLPVPNSISGKKVTLVLGGIIAVTMVMQFAKIQSHYRYSKAKNNLHSCLSTRTCKNYDFSILAAKKLPAEDTTELKKICDSGVKSACENTYLRKPASKKGP